MKYFLISDFNDYKINKEKIVFSIFSSQTFSHKWPLKSNSSYSKFDSIKDFILLCKSFISSFDKCNSFTVFFLDSHQNMNLDIETCVVSYFILVSIKFIKDWFTFITSLFTRSIALLIMGRFLHRIHVISIIKFRYGWPKLSCRYH